MGKKDSLFETIIVSANDNLVKLFLKNKIKKDHRIVIIDDSKNKLKIKIKKVIFYFFILLL